VLAHIDTFLHALQLHQQLYYCAVRSLRTKTKRSPSPLLSIPARDVYPRHLSHLLHALQLHGQLYHTAEDEDEEIVLTSAIDLGPRSLSTGVVSPEVLHALQLRGQLPHSAHLRSLLQCTR
jgi:hypothetical protein